MLANITGEEVDAFRRQIEVIDLIGCEEINKILEKVRELAEKSLKKEDLKKEDLTKGDLAKKTQSRRSFEGSSPAGVLHFPGAARLVSGTFYNSYSLNRCNCYLSGSLVAFCV